MKRIFKKNQIVLTLLAVMIAVAGYLNYIGKEAGTQDGVAAGLTDISEEDILAENQGGVRSHGEYASADPSQIGEASLYQWNDERSRVHYRSESE